jgi:hypothetical protein
MKRKPYSLCFYFSASGLFSLHDSALLFGKEWAIRSASDLLVSVSLPMMYTIHREADTAVSRRRHLEGAARPLAAAPYFHFRTSASGRAGSLRRLSRQSKASDDGTRRHVEGPR